MNGDLSVFNSPLASIFDALAYAQPTGGAVESKRLNVDWDDDENGYIVRAEIPGIGDESVDVSIENGILMIKAEYKEENKNCLRTGVYKWSAKVVDVDAEQITATVDKGVLIIKLPKSEKSKPRKILISKE